MKYLALAAMFVASVAHADDRKARADAVYHQGEQLYTAKSYLAAASAFEEAYQLDPDPAVLFNIAQAYRLGRACAQAARYYHLFLDKVEHPPDRNLLERYVTEMDACAKAEASATVPTVIHDTKVVHDTTIVRVPAHRSLRIAIGVGGAVALGIGAIFTIDVHHITSEREAACPPNCIYGPAVEKIMQLDTRGHRAEIAEGIFYAAGTAALIASAVLYVLSRGDADDRTVIATPLPGGGTVSASWRF